MQCMLKHIQRKQQWKYIAAFSFNHFKQNTMKNTLKAKSEFNQKLDELQKEIKPALTGHNLKEIVLYEKLLDMQEQINKLAGKVETSKLKSISAA